MHAAGHEKKAAQDKKAAEPKPGNKYSYSNMPGGVVVSVETPEGKFSTSFVPGCYFDEKSDKVTTMAAGQRIKALIELKAAKGK